MFWIRSGSTQGDVKFTVTHHLELFTVYIRGRQRLRYILWRQAPSDACCVTSGQKKVTTISLIDEMWAEFSKSALRWHKKYVEDVNSPLVEGYGYRKLK